MSSPPSRCAAFRHRAGRSPIPSSPASISSSTPTSVTGTSTIARSRATARRLDTYVASLAGAAVAQQPRDEQLAFWLNAYNTLVLRTVIDHYPIQGRFAEYPSKSIRQIPGAFERLPHRVAGKTLTLDQIEQTVLPEFHDPRVYFALGRGAVGSGRLRSEAFAGAKLEVQLTEAANECITRTQCVHIDRETNKVEASAIFSWREKEFAAAYADKAPPRLREPQPDRARDSRLRHPQAPDDRKGIPGGEHLPARLQAVRLDPQRPHRPWGTMNLDLDRQGRHRHRLEPGTGVGQRPALVQEGCRVTICARGEDVAQRGGGRPPHRCRAAPDDVLPVVADLSTAAGVGDGRRSDRRGLRRPRHPGQQRRPRQGVRHRRHHRRRVAGGVRPDAVSGRPRVAPGRAAHAAARRRRDRDDRVDLGPRIRRTDDLQRRQGRRNQPGEVDGAAAGRATTSASTASRRGRFGFLGDRGTAACRTIRRGWRNSSGGSCRSGDSAAPKRSGRSSRSSSSPRASWISGASVPVDGCQSRSLI